MRAMGAEVDMYDERSVTSAFDRSLLKFSSKFFEKKSMKYYDKILNQNRGKDYDYIFIVKCDMTPIPILKRMQKEYPKAKLCLYLWDSIENIPGILKKIPYFDSVHSFDPEDCKQYRQVSFRPLFFADEFRQNGEDVPLIYDLSFVGTIHSDRYAVIRQIRKKAEKHQLKTFWFCYLQSKYLYYIYKALKKEFRGTKLEDFDIDKMDSASVAAVVKQSKIVLDIQHPKQTGLTMRTIEMLGMNKKLITTNKSITDYDFYNPNNIRVIDRKNVKIDSGFLKSAYQPLDPEIYEKYSLEKWLLEVLS